MMATNLVVRRSTRKLLTTSVAIGLVGLVLAFFYSRPPANMFIETFAIVAALVAALASIVVLLQRSPQIIIAPEGLTWRKTAFTKPQTRAWCEIERTEIIRSIRAGVSLEITLRSSGTTDVADWSANLDYLDASPEQINDALSAYVPTAMVRS